ncbi:hypothetical protein HYT33_03915 [Candidatus Roizmanbacteria bacterium]|nr:hypothetical protein [Candidatus Roizmanbacteria bacterium]
MNRSLLERAKEFLSKHEADISKDQFFVIDEDVLLRTVEIAKIEKDDSVLEVGPGLGFLTEELAKRTKKVVAIEIDERFKPYLDKLPENVKVIYEDAYKFLNDKKERWQILPITKTVSNIPYSQAQNMLHNYTNISWYRGDLVWLAPTSVVDKVNKEPILGAYFKARVVEVVPKSAFYPQPNTTSAIMYFQRIPDPKQTGDFEIYFRRWLYNHEYLKVKNALREGIIASAKDLKKVTVTKNQARELIAKLKIPQEDLEKLANNINPTYYFEIPQRLQKWFAKLK